MIDGSKKRNRQLAFELQNSHVCEKRSKFTVMVSSQYAVTYSMKDLLPSLSTSYFSPQD